MLRQAHLLLLAAFLCGGVLFTFVLPPFHAPDEPAHWLNALNLIDGSPERPEFCSTAVAFEKLVPAGEVVWQQHLSFPTGRFRRAGELQPQCHAASSFYGSAFTYPGAFIASYFFPARHVDGNVAMAYFYASRLIGGLLIALLLWRLMLAVERGGVAPSAFTLLAFALSPLFLQQSFSVSGDGIVNAACIAALTLVLSGRALRWVDIALAVVVGTAAIATKPVVAPLLLATIGIAALAYFAKDATGKWGFTHAQGKRLAALIVVFLASFLWSRLSGDSVPLAKMPRPNFPVDADAQLAFMSAHPADVAGYMLQTIVDVSTNFRQFATSLGWLETAVPHQAVTRWLLLLKIAVMLDVALLAARSWRERAVLPRPERAAVMRTGAALLLGGAGLVVSGLLVTTFLYVTWTPVGAAEVRGVQPRYFFQQWFFLALTPAMLMARLYGARPTAAALSPVDAQTPRWRHAVAPAQAAVLIALVSLLAYQWLRVYVALAQRYW